MIRTPADLGALIRDRRRTLGLDQRALAVKAGTSRQWIVAIEQGKPRAAIGLILRTLQVLGVTLADASDSPSTPKRSEKTESALNINRIVESLRKPKK